MKTIKKLLVAGMLAIPMIFSQTLPVEAAAAGEYIELVEEEMNAEHLYSELLKQYPEVRLFSNLAESESRHANALIRALSRAGISTDDATIQELEIPPTLEEALAFALALEKEDIEMLQSLLEDVEDSRLERVLKNLLHGSQRHHEALEKAISGGIDNPDCNETGPGSNGRRQRRQKERSKVRNGRSSWTPAGKR